MRKINKFLETMINRIGIGEVSDISKVNATTIKNWRDGNHKIRKDTLIKLKSNWDKWNSENTDLVIEFCEDIDKILNPK